MVLSWIKEYKFLEYFLILNFVANINLFFENEKKIYRIFRNSYQILWPRLFFPKYPIYLWIKILTNWIDQSMMYDKFSCEKFNIYLLLNSLFVSENLVFFKDFSNEPSLN